MLRAVNYAIVGSSIVPVVVVIMFAIQQSQTVKQAEIPVAKNPTFKIGMYGQSFALEDAEEIVGYKIKLPKYLPEGNSLRMIKVDKLSKWSFAIYSPAIIDDSTEEKMLIENGGFILVNTPAPEVADVDAEIQRFVEFGGEEITIGNIRGVGISNIPLIKGYSEIHWWEDGLHRIVGANFSFIELKKIIESI